MDDHREAHQVTQRHDQMPFLRCQVVHRGFLGGLA